MGTTNWKTIWKGNFNNQQDVWDLQNDKQPVIRLVHEISLVSAMTYYILVMGAKGHFFTETIAVVSDIET